MKKKDKIQKQLKHYFKEIKRNLPCYNKTMRKMLDDLKFSVCAFLYESDSVTMEKIEQRFGTPESIAAEFTAGVDGAYIKSYKLKKRVAVIVISIFAAILVAVSALVIYIIADGERNQPIYVDTDITYNEGK